MIESRLYVLGDRLRTDISSQYHTINAGGCALFALMLGNKLKDLGYDIKYTVISNDNDLSKRKAFDKYKDDIVVLNENSIYINHVFVKVNGMLMDCKGAHKELIDTQYAHLNILAEVDATTLVGWINTDGVWNSGMQILKQNKTNIDELLNMIIKDLFPTYQ